MNAIPNNRDGHDGDIPGDSDDLLAAEYVLGLLDSAVQRSVQARVDTDPAFAREVAAWESRFAPWLDAIAPVAVPERIWPRIRQILGHVDPAPPMIATPATHQPSLWDRLPFWRGLAAGGFAVAAASLAALFITVRTMPVEPPSAAPQVVTVPPLPAPPRVVTVPPIPVLTPAPAPMVVSIRHDDGSAAYSATVDPDTGVITLIPAFMPEDARVPELWLIPADGVPRSLGVVARDRAMRVTIPAAIRAGAAVDSVFAVSLEPQGGSPTGQPTGPVVAKGSLIEL